MTTKFKQEINNTLFTIIRSYVDHQQPFYVAVYNNDTLKELSKEPVVVLGVKEWALETAGYDITTNTLLLNVVFGETPVEMTFTLNDILSIVNDKGIRVFVKPFTDKNVPNLELTLENLVPVKLNTPGILHSLTKFQEYNTKLNIAPIIKEVKTSL